MAWSDAARAAAAEVRAQHIKHSPAIAATRKQYARALKAIRLKLRGSIPNTEVGLRNQMAQRGASAIMKRSRGL